VSIAPLITIDGLGVTYGHGKSAFQALSDVSLDIRPGETMGLVGESGSGKTTIGRAVLGLAPVTEGSIRFEGAEIANASRRRRRSLARDIQVIFQDPYGSLNPALTVADILSEPLIAQGVSRRDARARIRGLLDMVHLPTDTGERYPREFSGGQRQRIAIARALALQPKLVICDEPVSALDLTTQARVLELMIEIQERTGVAYLFVSHDLAVVRHISHRVTVIYRGKIVEQGSAAEVTEHPRDLYTRKLFMSAPLPDVRRQRERREQLEALAAAEAST